MTGFPVSTLAGAVASTYQRPWGKCPWRLERGNLHEDMRPRHSDTEKHGSLFSHHIWLASCSSLLCLGLQCPRL